MKGDDAEEVVVQLSDEMGWRWFREWWLLLKGVCREEKDATL